MIVGHNLSQPDIVGLVSLPVLTIVAELTVAEHSSNQPAFIRKDNQLGSVTCA